MLTYYCPNCNKVVRARRREDAPYRPFCSHRCQMIDFGKWLSGEYRICERPASKDSSNGGLRCGLNGGRADPP